MVWHPQGPGLRHPAVRRADHQHREEAARRREGAPGAQLRPRQGRDHQDGLLRPGQADDLADHTYHLHTASRSVQQEMERQELGAQVQAGIDKLSPDLRTCVILRDIEELSYQEIVDLLEIPEGTVKSRINRGRIELAKILRRMKVLAASEA